MLGPEDMVPPSHLAYQHKVLSETPDSRVFFFSQSITLAGLEQVGLELIEICLPLVLSAGIKGLH